MPSAGDVMASERLADVCVVGVDLVPVAEVAGAIAHFGDRYTGRLFTDHELATCAGPSAPESLAARFAAKEAAIKVLTPSGASPPWRDVEVRRRRSGACRVELHGRAARLADARGIGPMSVSLSHEAGLAVAVVVAMRSRPKRDGAEPHGADLRSEPTSQPTSQPTDQPTDQPTEQNRSMAMTTTEKSTQRIRAVLAEHGRLPVDVATLSDDDDLFQAGMTSHASVNVMLALEDAFDVEFPEVMLRKSTFSSIGSLRRALAELVAMEVPA